MVKINIAVTKNVITSYIAEGHATVENSATEKTNKLSSSICSAVSILEYNFLYSVQILVDSELVTADIRDGFFKLNVQSEFLKKINELDKKRLALEVLSQSFLIGMNALKKKYPQEINLVIN